MKPALPLLILAGVALLRAAEVEKPLPPPEERHGGWQFSLLPRAFQKRPLLDFAVITEMTADGKRFPPPSPGKPVYYRVQPGKFTQMGNEAPANERPPPIEELQRAMQSALGAGGFVESVDGNRPPQLLVVFNYGSFARFATGQAEANAEAEAIQAYLNALDANARSPNPKPAPEPPAATLSPDTADQLLPYVMQDVTMRRDVIERAALIGGAKFAQELNEAIEREIDYRQTRTIPGPPETDPSSPLNLFRKKNRKLEYFVEESFSSCYFVIASAYDYTAAGKGERVLLWRTKMTVNSLGISMTESLPALVLSSGPYLGRPMTEAATLSKRIVRDGRVEVGTPTVVEEKPEKK